MNINWKTALALVVFASAPITLRATPQNSSGEPLTSKEVRKAEATAKTAGDHVRLAVYYEGQAKAMQSKLAEAEDLVNYWAQKSYMVNNTKVPNPYWSAKNQVATYRTEMERNTKLAADHRRTAESLQGNQRAQVN